MKEFASNEYIPMTPSPAVAPSDLLVPHQHGTLLIGFLTFFSIILLLVCCYLAHLQRPTQHASTATVATRNNAAAAAAAAASALGEGRLDPNVLASLPIFAYSSVAHAAKRECAVCLAEFKEGEQGRLLPRCHHRFHAECIGMWFDSHSTCPLCRLTVGPEDSDSAL